MSVLYLLDSGSYVHKEGGRLIIKKEKKTIQQVHIFKLSQIVLIGNITLTNSVIKTLLYEGIDVVFMTKTGKYLGRLQSPKSKNIILRKNQFKRFDDPDFILNTAKLIIMGKLRNQKALLQRIQRASKKELGLEKVIAYLRQLSDRCKTAKNLEELRGYEGQAAAAYFPAWSKGLKIKEINFTNRNRRPPKDPVNALLSLGYALLLNNIISVLELVGLDPYLGTLHTIEYGRPSLALDLMEEWRPIIIDSLVLSVFNLGVLTSTDFTNFIKEDETSIKDEQKGIYLTDAGWRKYITQFERKISTEITFHLNKQHIPYRSAIEQQIRHFVRYLISDDPTYIPISFK